MDFQIKRDIGQYRHIPFSVHKLMVWLGLPDGEKKFEDMCNRFERIPGV